MIPTTYVLYLPDGTQQPSLCDLSQRPEVEELRAVICPLLGGADLERVRVLLEGPKGPLYADLFVDERSAAKGLPRNEAATSLYRALSLKRSPGLDPETLPAIYGPAVLFHRPVWF